MAARYWRGGTGTWDATNTTNWSTTSGGTGGASVPTSADTVYFNASSGSGICTISSAKSVQGIDFSGCSVTFSNVSNYNLDASGGNIVLGSTSNITNLYVRLAPTGSLSTTISGSATVSRVDLYTTSSTATASLGSNVTLSLIHI